MNEIREEMSRNLLRFKEIPAFFMNKSVVYFICLSLFNYKY